MLEKWTLGLFCPAFRPGQFNRQHVSQVYLVFLWNRGTLPGCIKCTVGSSNNLFQHKRCLCSVPCIFPHIRNYSFREIFHPHLLSCHVGSTWYFPPHAFKQKGESNHYKPRNSSWLIQHCLTWRTVAPTSNKPPQDHSVPFLLSYPLSLDLIVTFYI